MRFAAVLVWACLASTVVTCAPPPAVAAPEPATVKPSTVKPSVEELFNAFGLFGRWANTCAAPATPDNPYVTIKTPTTGLVLEDHDLGPDYTVNRYSVVAAQKVGPERLSVEVIFQPGAEGEERQTLEFLVRGATRRTMFNRTADGTVRVKGGIAVAMGTRTQLLRKCETKE